MTSTTTAATAQRPRTTTTPTTRPTTRTTPKDRTMSPDPRHLIRTALTYAALFLGLLLLTARGR